MTVTLSWNEVRDRAIKLSREWAGEWREDAEAKSFRDAFFEVFGKSHAALEKAEGLCYRKEPFQSDRDRVEHLFAICE